MMAVLTPRNVRSADGSILIEVLVALVVLSLFVVSLSQSINRMLGRAHELGSMVAAVETTAEAAHDGGMPGLWGWGPRVESAVWRPGPCLEVQVGCGGEAGAAVGVWTDGWLGEEHEPDQTGCVSVPSSQLVGLAGAELVIRARGPEGVWGPPLRTVVPDRMGDLSFLTAVTPVGGPTTGLEYDGASLVHAPCRANPALDLPWLREGPPACLGGLLFLLPQATPGLCEAGLGGRNQWWPAEEGRAVDVYF